jgi:hypothetical protein
VSLFQSILGTRKAAGDLLSAFRQYTLGFPMGSNEKQAGIPALGEMFHHAVAAAKMAGVTKVPPATAADQAEEHAHLPADRDRPGGQRAAGPPIFSVTLQAQLGAGTKEVARQGQGRQAGDHGQAFRCTRCRS